MARMVQCIKLAQPKALTFPYPGELGKRIWQNVSKGSLGRLDQTPDHAGERKSPEPGRRAPASTWHARWSNIFRRR